MSTQEPSEFWGDYPAWAWDKPSRAILASDGEYGIVVHYQGPHIAMQVKEYGHETLEELCLEDCPKGIWVWEGTYEEDSEGDLLPKGEFRAATDGEWLRLQRGNPWDERDWRDPGWEPDEEEGDDDESDDDGDEG